MNPRPNKPPMPRGLRRRTVLGASVVGAVGAAGLLSGCGSSDGDSSAASSDDPSASSSPSESASASEDAGGGALAKTADVPVGGGTILKDEKIVVTQPTAGTFKAFTAVCTHMQCLVGAVKDGVISCPCHGSQYSAADGTVKKGPAPKALTEVPVKVQGDEIVKS